MNDVIAVWRSCCLLSLAFSVRIKKVKFPILVTERWARSWSRCTGSQPAGDVKWSRHIPSSSFAVAFCRACGYPRSVHLMVLPVNGSTHLISAYYSFIDPERMKGWVGLVGWPVADGLPTLVVTHQLQIERRTGKVRRPETDVLPLSHATKMQ